MPQSDMNRHTPLGFILPFKHGVLGRAFFRFHVFHTISCRLRLRSMQHFYFFCCGFRFVSFLQIKINIRHQYRCIGMIPAGVLHPLNLCWNPYVYMQVCVCLYAHVLFCPYSNIDGQIAEGKSRGETFLPGFDQALNIWKSIKGVIIWAQIPLMYHPCPFFELCERKGIMMICKPCDTAWMVEHLFRSQRSFVWLRKREKLLATNSCWHAVVALISWQHMRWDSSNIMSCVKGKLFTICPITYPVMVHHGHKENCFFEWTKGSKWILNWTFLQD